MGDKESKEKGSPTGNEKRWKVSLQMTSKTTYAITFDKRYFEKIKSSIKASNIWRFNDKSIWYTNLYFLGINFKLT